MPEDEGIQEKNAPTRTAKPDEELGCFSGSLPVRTYKGVARRKAFHRNQIVFSCLDG